LWTIQGLRAVGACSILNGAKAETICLKRIGADKNLTVRSRLDETMHGFRQALPRLIIVRLEYMSMRCAGM
jgi:hypothetical protein